jgi:transglutaminase-like putative cysteine protease
MVVWREHRLTFDPTTVLMQSGYILGAALGVVLLVSVLPTPRAAPLGSLRDSVEGVVEAAEAQFSRLFNGLPSRRSYRTITYGAETRFRGNPNLTDDLLFTVRGARGTYWRARSYTDYTSTGWETGEAEFGPFTSGDGLSDERRVSGEYEFKVSAATDTFFTAGLPRSFDEAAEALASFEAPWDVLQVRYSEGRDFFPTRTNLNYVSVGIESTATDSQLKQAEGEYPDWVTDRYLQLPETLPQRVRNLAIDLTFGMDNPLDKVEALREHVISLPYNLDINAPPEGMDGVDYFLFGIRQGYCDYYASSLAVMARSLGIPARYVLGYASGQFDPRSNSYQVLELNYHSWVEIYFPEYGWMPFEATPPNAVEFGGGTTLSAPPGVVDAFDFSGEGLLLDEEDEEGLGGAFQADQGFGPSLRSVLTVLAIAAVAALGFTWWRWWLRLGSLDRADELYAKMLRLAVLLGIPQRRDQTPIEYGESLGEEMPESVADIRMLSWTYASRRYAGYPVSMQQLRLVEQSWERLRWRMIKRMFRVRPA